MIDEKKQSPREGDLTGNEKRQQDDYLEEALEETFPASDPIAPGSVPERSVTRPGDKRA
ncbi:hypothetical protein [Neorhizobium alkalisoli]|uniref:Uncharacterized protein n=1 Tax=Neorhizobium alkalisoli TaxID=528178 RepID=A0A561QBH7_9HYPH|nr:hypothetical protein [Neorhizobium alkalisoli]TWF47726.1 hypothetical protein FHW37_11022 [Neorhizobium alkalisoli]